MQRFGIEEHQLVKAVLTTENSGENKVRQEVEKIAAWISSETKRNEFKRKLSLIDAKRFPSPNLRWHLGIRSSSEPMDIMMRIYQSLKSMNFEWQTINPYHIIVRPKISDTEETSKVNIIGGTFCNFLYLLNVLG